MKVGIGMLRYVKLSNYRSLKELTVDFMATAEKPKDFVLIYGENGVGKSNFVNAFETLNDILSTMSRISRVQTLAENMSQDETGNGYKVPDSLHNYGLSHYLDSLFIDISTIVNKNKTIGSEENMILEYGFQIDGKDGVYRIEMDEQQVVVESLEYMLEKNKTTYFNITKEMLDEGDKAMKSSIFVDKTFRSHFHGLLQKYWGKHALLSILAYEVGTTNEGYVEERVSNGLLKVLDYLSMICTKISSHNDYFGTYSTQHHVLANIIRPRGFVREDDLVELTVAENLLNSFFTNLYSDIKRVYYKRERDEQVIRYRLFFQKLIYGELVEVDFKLESAGTQNLFKILPYLLSACDGHTVVIDEIDAGIHDLLMEGIFNSVIPDITGQLIMTTHNTRLMEAEEIKDSNIYVFNVDKEGRKELFPITEFGRVQQNHNVRKRYLNGLYGGTPFSSEIDFTELLDDLQSEVE